MKRWFDVLTFPSLPVLCLFINMPHPVKSYGSWLQKSRHFKLSMNFKVFGLPSSPYSISRKTDAQRKITLFRHNFLNSRTSDLMIGDLVDLSLKLWKWTWWHFIIFLRSKPLIMKLTQLSSLNFFWIALYRIKYQKTKVWRHTVFKDIQYVSHIY